MFIGCLIAVAKCQRSNFGWGKIYFGSGFQEKASSRVPQSLSPAAGHIMVADREWKPTFQAHPWWPMSTSLAQAPKFHEQQGVFCWGPNIETHGLVREISPSNHTPQLDILDLIRSAKCLLLC